ncbi:MAG: GTP cyclohydrolase I [Bacteroidales bacterium]|jgi:GTP cyclohydrolase I|nr:GTP cyclohydrolase I [Bacteroidales bacterium]
METVRTNTQAVEHSIRDIFRYIGENPDRQGLADTPSRIIRMWKEIFRGYDESQKPVITTFQNGADGIVYSDIIIDSGNFYSMCEHHMMPFFGTYHFAYIPHPAGKILGLSKIARVIDYHAAKLQIQERLATDIVQDIKSALCGDFPPHGIVISITAEHLCKSMRGVRKQGTMTTIHKEGIFNEKEVLDEFSK